MDNSHRETLSVPAGDQFHERAAQAPGHTSPSRDVAHTPGPWRVHKSMPNEARGVSEETEIRGGNYVVVRLGRTPNDANARLIAAAPDMLAALTELLADMDDRELVDISGAAIVRARQAVAKATGAES